MRRSFLTGIWFAAAVSGQTIAIRAGTVLDGEVVAGDGSEGIQAVFEARNRSGSPMAFAAFDLLELDGQRVMGEPWTARRNRLEDLLEAPPPGVCLVPVTEDAPALWDTWVGMGGEGLPHFGRQLKMGSIHADIVPQSVKWRGDGFIPRPASAPKAPDRQLCPGIRRT